MGGVALTSPGLDYGKGSLCPMLIPSPVFILYQHNVTSENDRHTQPRRSGWLVEPPRHGMSPTSHLLIPPSQETTH